ncbi:MAG: uroporphyrinogen-III synthase [Rhodospirillaceae bacterium]|nr:uroporphyrinogen-III synthase [Rhodospirillaceae bacterium]
MSRPCWLVTRPQPEADALAARLRRLGHGAVVCPVMEIRVDPAQPLDLDGVGTLVFTSANGVRAFAARCPSRHLPAIAVGGRTAAAARQAGFADVRAGGGTVAQLQQAFPALAPEHPGVVLHVCGRDVAGDLPHALTAHGYTVRSTPLYAAEPAASLGPDAAAALANGDISGVLFFSARTARLFDTLSAEAGLRPALHHVLAVCLSPAIASELPGSCWREIWISPMPTSESLIETLRQYPSPPKVPLRS